MADAMKLADLIEEQADNFACGLQDRNFLRDDDGSEPLGREMIRLNLEQFAKRLAASPPAREEAPAEGVEEYLNPGDLFWGVCRAGNIAANAVSVLRTSPEKVGLVIDALDRLKAEMDSVINDPSSALRNRTSEPEAGEAHKVEWVNDASNVNDRRMYIDGQQWAKVYGWDEVSLNARCDALQIAMQHPAPAPATADKLRDIVQRCVNALDASRNGGEYPDFAEWEADARQALAALNEGGE